MHQYNNSGPRYLEWFCFDLSYTSSPYKLMCIHSNIWRWTVCCGGPITVLVWNGFFEQALNKKMKACTPLVVLLGDTAEIIYGVISCFLGTWKCISWPCLCSVFCVFTSRNSCCRWQNGQAILFYVLKPVIVVNRIICVREHGAGICLSNYEGALINLICACDLHLWFSRAVTTKYLKCWGKQHL